MLKKKNPLAHYSNIFKIINLKLIYCLKFNALPSDNMYSVLSDLLLLVPVCVFSADEEGLRKDCDGD